MRFLVFIACLFAAAAHAGPCDDSSDREALKPFLNSPDAILAKCQNTANAPHSVVACKGLDGKTEQLPACACTWRLLNSCAEDYLEQKAGGALPFKPPHGPPEARPPPYKRLRPSTLRQLISNTR
jgi:hypothetical protein